MESTLSDASQAKSSLSGLECGYPLRYRRVCLDSFFFSFFLLHICKCRHICTYMNVYTGMYVHTYMSYICIYLYMHICLPHIPLFLSIKVCRKITSFRVKSPHAKFFATFTAWGI